VPGDYSLWHCLSRRLAFSWLKLAHAPAGATTLIVSLGVIARFFHLLVLEIAVALLWVQAFQPIGWCELSDLGGKDRQRNGGSNKRAWPPAIIGT
jgi:hypothetical protein